MKRKLFYYTRFYGNNLLRKLLCKVRYAAIIELSDKENNDGIGFLQKGENGDEEKSSNYCYQFYCCFCFQK